MGHGEPTPREGAAAGGAIGVVRSMTPRLLFAYAVALALLGGCVGLARAAGSDEEATRSPDLLAGAERVGSAADVSFRGDSSTLEVGVPVLTSGAVAWLRELGGELDLPASLAHRMASTTSAEGEQVVRAGAVEVTWEQTADEGFQALLVADP